jgi:zinc and cadmium transporter
MLHRHAPTLPAPAHDHALARGAGHAVLVGDTLHNAVDGVMITAAFLVSVPLGIATSIAVFAHEIPQELGDLAILLNSGFKPWQAYLFNFLSGLASLVGAIAAYMAQAAIPGFIPYLLALAAASFLYLVASNLDPVVHHTPSRRGDMIQMGSLLAGVAGLFVLHRFLA